MNDADTVLTNVVIFGDMVAQGVRDGDDAFAARHDAVVPTFRRHREVVGRVKCRDEADVGLARRSKCAMRRRPTAGVQDVDVLALDQIAEPRYVPANDERVFGMQRQFDMSRANPF